MEVVRVTGIGEKGTREDYKKNQKGLGICGN